MLNNIQLTNVPTAVGVVGGEVVLSGGTTTIASWGLGNVYSGTNPSGTFTKGNIPAPNKASSLTTGGRIFGRGHPQYEDYAVDQFVSVRSQGATGDGSTDDTAALNAVFAAVCDKRPLFRLEYQTQRLSVTLVRWLQDYLHRCWYLLRYFDSQHPRRYPNRRRGVVSHHGRRF